MTFTPLQDTCKSEVSHFRVEHSREVLLNSLAVKGFFVSAAEPRTPTRKITPSRQHWTTPRQSLSTGARKKMPPRPGSAGRSPSDGTNA